MTDDLSPAALAEAETRLLVPESRRVGGGGRVFHEALDCLLDAHVRFCLLRDDPADLDRIADLDLLVHPGDRKIAAAALERAGFAVKRDRRLGAKSVWLRHVGGCFHVLDVHFACVQGGIEYMHAQGALSRLETGGPVPCLGREDRFLHLFFHNALGKPALQPKHAAALRALHAAGLDAGRLADQTRPFGTADVVRRLLEDFDAAVGDPARWAKLVRAARRTLLRRPANRLGVLRYRHGDRLRWRPRPVVIALLGPDGTGKTSLQAALDALLRGSPLSPGRVYMGCWGHDHLPMRFARRLTPPQVSPLRLLARACGVQVGLSDAERAALADGARSRARLALRVLGTAVKNAAFAVALAAELGWRYVRHVALSRRPVVLADRWVYDLEFRHGRAPFDHGAKARGLFYRLFPRPDGILYLTAPYDLVAARKPQLDRASFEAMDRGFRRVLAPYAPLVLTSDTSPEDLARTFLARHWESILARCNARA